MTSQQLALELEVVPRTILRDVDALTEAGLPIIVHQGNQGGIELGFNYRTRLTGLATDEAEAMAVILARPIPELGELGMAQAGQRARSKLLESFPDTVRMSMELARRRFQFAARPHAHIDPRVSAMADAIRRSGIVRIKVRTASPRAIHPVSLIAGADGWAVVDAINPDPPIALPEWGDISISARTFALRSSKR